MIYNRTSDRRRLKLINHRKRKREEEESKGGEARGAKKEDGNDRKRQAGARGESPDSGKTETPGTIVPGVSGSGMEAKNTKRVAGGAAAAAAAAATKQSGDQGRGAVKGKKGGGGLKGRKKGGKKGKGGVKEEAVREVEGIEKGSAVPLSVWTGEGVGDGLGYVRNEDWMNGGAGSRDSELSRAELLTQSTGTEGHGHGAEAAEQNMRLPTPGIGLEIEIEGLGRELGVNRERGDVFSKGFEGSFEQRVEPLSIGRELGTMCGIDEVGLVSVGQGNGRVEERGFVGGGMGIGGENIGLEQLWPREEEEERGSGGIGRSEGGELWMFGGEEEGRDGLLGVLEGGM